MPEDDDILAELTTRFPFLQGKGRIQRARRIYLTVPADKITEVLTHLFGPMRFMMLTAITGLDSGANLEVIYHICRNSGVLLNVYISVPKDNPVIQTIIPLFPAADVYERELVDLLGMKVEGLPEGSRYPLPDGWPDGQFPLRKDWTPDKLTAAASPGAATYPAIPPKETKHV